MTSDDPCKNPLAHEHVSVRNLLLTLSIRWENTVSYRLSYIQPYWCRELNLTPAYSQALGTLPTYVCSHFLTPPWNFKYIFIFCCFSFLAYENLFILYMCVHLLYLNEEISLWFISTHILESTQPQQSTSTNLH